MITKTCVTALNSSPNYRYVVIMARSEDVWLFSRHKARNSWEMPGGHIEPGETPIDAAKRELYEETGALDFDIAPAFDYMTEDDTGRADYGMVFVADVRVLGDMPESEMSETRRFDALPDALTYPDIAPEIFAAVTTRLFARKSAE